MNRCSAVVIVFGLLLYGNPVHSFAELLEIAAQPTPTIIRYDEDWSALGMSAKSSGRWTDAFKYIPLDRSERIYLTTGLELRLRDETYQNNNWGSAPAPDDGYLWMRALPYIDFHAGPVRAFIQPIASYASGVEPAAGPIDQTGLDLLQGFADTTVPLDGGVARLTLRAGRSMMSLGSERLVGTRYGPNVPLAFDGGHAILSGSDSRIDVFYVRPVEPGLHNFDDRTSRARALWGAYATRDLDFGSTSGIDLYYLGYSNDDATYNQGSGREARHSIGTRFFGRAAEWHWNAEVVAQFGEFDGASIRAWTMGTEGGYQFADVNLEPDARIRFDIASGDNNPHDRRLQTFNALFPKGKYFGELSPVGPYNLINLQPAVTLALTATLELDLSANFYWRQSTGDGVYDVPGHLLRAADGSSARHIGNEAEVALGWQVSPELALSGSLGAFVPGAFIRQTGPAETIYMLGLEANYRF